MVLPNNSLNSKFFNKIDYIIEEEFENNIETSKILLLESKIKLPIQIHGKLITTIDTTKGYSEKEILKSIYELDKIKIKYKIKK